MESRWTRLIRLRAEITKALEIARQIGAPRERIFAAGDHLNDLPMLSGEFAPGDTIRVERGAEGLEFNH